MKIFYAFARYFTGALFIFSGLIKVNDPVGTAIKLEEYFTVFAYDFAPFFEWFVPAALVLSVVLSVLEVVLGVAVIVGFRMELTSKVLLALIVFFTFLTFYSAYFNKVTDCGCFGDAIKLTPWQSFTKDIILLVLIVAIYIHRKHYSSFFSPAFRLMKVAGAAIFFTAIAIYAILHLPFIDFRSYKIGNDIRALMQPSAPLRYEYVVEKDGKEFRLEKYPTDPAYTFKSMNLLNPEAQPKITDLSVWNDEDDFTEAVLTGNKLLIIIHNVAKTSTNDLDAIKALTEANAEVWVLTASGYEQFEAFRHEHQLAIPYYYADATVLKTIIRSNPGIVLLSNGVVKGKWHYNDTPDVSTINRLLN